jgi:hypothetical protein
MKVAEPDSEEDKKARVIVVQVKEDNTLVLSLDIKGEKLMTVSLMKDVFMVLTDQSRMKTGIHTIISTGLYDTCKRVDIDSLPEDYRDSVKKLLQDRNDGATTILQTGLEVPPGYKTTLYISTIEGE